MTGLRFFTFTEHRLQSSPGPLHGAVSLLCNAEQKIQDTDCIFLKGWHAKGLGNFFTLTLFSLISFDSSHHSPLIKAVLETKLLWINLQKQRLNYPFALFLKTSYDPSLLIQTLAGNVFQSCYATWLPTCARTNMFLQIVLLSQAPAFSAIWGTLCRMVSISSESPFF